MIIARNRARCAGVQHARTLTNRDALCQISITPHSGEVCVAMKVSCPTGAI